MRKSILLLLLAVLCHGAFSQTNPVTDDDLTARDFTQSNVVAIIDLNCDPCKEPAVKITIPTATAVTVYSNDILYFKQSITISTIPLKLIKSIKAELTYFEYTPDTDNCFPCNKNSATFGNFDSCTLITAGVGKGTHSMVWNYIPPKNPGVFPAVFNITLPPTVKCCTGTLRWCIRYVIEFDDCSVCSKTVCYEKRKTTVTPVPVIDPTTLPNRQN